MIWGFQSQAVRQLRIVCAGLMAVALGAGAASAQVQAPSTEPPIHMIIGLDLSASNPLVESSDYAAKVAGRVEAEIEDLPFKSVVMLRTFGIYSGTANAMDYTVQISARERPEDVAGFVGELIGAVPELVRVGTLRKQQRTNILPFLENMADAVNCNAIDTRLILATDGIEDSEYAKLANPRSKLPTPDYEMFGGCTELQMLGIGQGADSPKTTARLKDEWSSWAEAAGFENFVGLNDW